MAARKSPKAARDANPDNAIRKKMREHHKSLGVPKGKTPKIIRSPQSEVDKINKNLKKHFANEKKK